MTVRDPTLGQIIGGKLQRHAVTSHDPDAVPAQPSRHHRKDDLPGIEFNGKHAGKIVFGCDHGFAAPWVMTGDRVSLEVPMI